MPSIDPPVPCTTPADPAWVVCDYGEATRPPDWPATGPRLQGHVRAAMRTRRYSRRTKQGYVARIRRFVLLYGKRHSMKLGGKEITA